jgi:huntingtin
LKKAIEGLKDVKNLSHVELILETIYSTLITHPDIKDFHHFDNIIIWISNTLKDLFKLSDFVEKYQNPPIFDDVINENLNSIKQAIFIAKFTEFYEDGDLKFILLTSKQNKIVELSFKLSKLILRENKYYQFVITPYEVMCSYRFGDNMLDVDTLKLKQIPIEYLSDCDLLERYIHRINRYGFTQRKEFEEIFMTLLVLLNQWNDMQDVDEQFCVKQLCFQMNIDLILSCFRHQNYDSNYCNFSHLPRSERWAKMDMIGVKKLHHIQEILSSKLNVFYQSNLERIDIEAGSNAVSTKSFGMNQFSLSYTWHLTNEVTKKDHVIRNMTYVHTEKLEVDFKSALQLVYDLMTQIIDENPVLVLPQLAKLVDVLDNMEQFKWINKKMLSLYEFICTEDTISHQYIVYLLCRSSAVLVPTLSDLQQIVPMLNKYLGCNHMFVRNATLEGLLCLFESLVKANTLIGGSSDELKLLRTTIANYVNKNGIVYESTSTSSTAQHDKLVWTLNFYVLECTLKFGDCNELLIDTIISANNILKRSNDADLFFLIVNVSKYLKFKKQFYIK